MCSALQTLRCNGVSREDYRKVRHACKDMLPYLTEARACQQKDIEHQVRMHTIANAAIVIAAGYCVKHVLS